MTLYQQKKGEWIVKGFIDIAKNIYTISADTKVISKIMELVLFPYICNFAKSKNYKIFLCKAQNFYPDVSLLNDKGIDVSGKLNVSTFNLRV